MTLSASLPTEDASGNPIDDTRRIFGGMVATAADGTPRLGVIDPDPSTPIVTGTSSMAYLVKGDVLFVTQRDSSTGGVELSVNDAVASIATTTAPVANSRIDVIWIKCQFDVYGDSGLYAPTFGVTQGTAASSPTEPSIPAGATKIATAVVTSSDVTTETVVITDEIPFTAMAGGTVLVRNSVELAAWEPADGAFAYQLDTDMFWVRVDGGWAAGGVVTGALSGGTNVDYSGTRLRRVGKRNVLQGRIEKTSGSFATNEAVAGLPAGTFPAAEVVAPIVLMTSGFTATVGVGVVGIDGVIRVNYTGISGQVYAHVDLVWDS